MKKYIESSSLYKYQNWKSGGAIWYSARRLGLLPATVINNLFLKNPAAIGVDSGVFPITAIITISPVHM